MKSNRILRGIGLLLGSALISAFITFSTGYDSVGTVAVSTIVGFVAGMYFTSGVYAK